MAGRPISADEDSGRVDENHERLSGTSREPTHTVSACEQTPGSGAYRLEDAERPTGSSEVGRSDTMTRLLAVATMIAGSVVAVGTPAGGAVAVTATVQGNAAVSGRAALSSDGRYVAFASAASNLVSGDTNARTDNFVRDRTTSTTRRVSVGDSGRQANGASEGPTISADGRYVAFTSTASNLVPGDTNRASDVFLRDLTMGRTVRVSTTRSGAQANRGSDQADLAASGKFVAFVSVATNLVGSDTNGASDVFVRDVSAGATTRVSVSETGKQADGDSYGASISSDGLAVGFGSYATNLLPLSYNGSTYPDGGAYVRDRAARTTTGLATQDSNPGCGSFGAPGLSDDGTTAVWDTRHGCDVDFYTVDKEDLATGLQQQIAAPGSYYKLYSDGAVSATGSKTAYYDEYRDVIALRSWTSGREITRSRTRGELALSGDGRSVAITTSQALTGDDTNAVDDVYIWTPDIGRVRRVSVG